MRYEKHARLALAYQSFSDMQIAHFEKCEDVIEGTILGCAAPRCAAAVKGELVVEVSEGHGQIARACEDRGFLSHNVGPWWTRCG